MPRSLYLARHAGIEADGIAISTDLTRAPRWIAREALKNVLAFAESQHSCSRSSPIRRR